MSHSRRVDTQGSESERPGVWSLSLDAMLGCQPWVPFVHNLLIVPPSTSLHGHGHPLLLLRACLSQEVVCPQRTLGTAVVHVSLWLKRYSWWKHLRPEFQPVKKFSPSVNFIIPIHLSLRLTYLPSVPGNFPKQMEEHSERKGKKALYQDFENSASNITIFLAIYLILFVVYLRINFFIFEV